MSELQILNHPEFQKIRTMESEVGQPLFCATSGSALVVLVTWRRLLVRKAKQRSQRHCRNVVKKETLISGKVQEINYIAEPDVYCLTIRSKLPSAVKIEKFLFEEVLHSIRKHGMFLAEPTVQNILDTENGVEIFQQALTQFIEFYPPENETG